MKHLMEKLEQLLEWGGIPKDITFLVISGAAVICSLLRIDPFSRLIWRGSPLSSVASPSFWRP